MRALAIIGVGGLGRMARLIVDEFNRHTPTWELACFLDDNQAHHGEAIGGVPIAGGVRELLARPELWAVIAIARTSTRRRIAAALRNEGFARFATLVHPLAWIGQGTTLGAGTIVYPGALVDGDVRIGAHAVLNKGCTIGHDALIEDYVTLGPGVNLGGAVRVGEGVDLGIGSCTVQGISIGPWSIVGAGAAVVGDLPANVTAVGVPARPLKTRPPGWHEQ